MSELIDIPLPEQGDGIEKTQEQQNNIRNKGSDMSDVSGFFVDREGVVSSVGLVSGVLLDRLRLQADFDRGRGVFLSNSFLRGVREFRELSVVLSGLLGKGEKKDSINLEEVKF